ncbi:hypothetical protein EZV73_14570 [Acidaminobacter sp. JC074]|uniref:hypothetical protein n=1 Tax=Acidaminobacter sp. JC074 TaxID=2530199 RepID=UPI001F0DEFFE|nr:hypothetical protein [Acidaminobacter sp. JC074]MCH4888816.1 hypothetical protein [Acidaminobacter sp. JC074]
MYKEIERIHILDNEFNLVKFDSSKLVEDDYRKIYDYDNLRRIDGGKKGIESINHFMLLMKVERDYFENKYYLLNDAYDIIGSYSLYIDGSLVTYSYHISSFYRFKELKDYLFSSGMLKASKLGDVKIYPSCKYREDYEFYIEKGFKCLVRKGRYQIPINYDRAMVDKYQKQAIVEFNDKVPDHMIETYSTIISECQGEYEASVVASIVRLIEEDVKVDGNKQYTGFYNNSGLISYMVVGSTSAYIDALCVLEKNKSVPLKILIASALDHLKRTYSDILYLDIGDLDKSLFKEFGVRPILNYQLAAKDIQELL